MGADRSERPGRRAGILRRLFSSLPSRRCFNAVRFDGHLSSGLSPHDEAHKETTDPLPSYCQFGGGFRARLHRDVNSGPDGSVQSANSAVVRRIEADEFSGFGRSENPMRRVVGQRSPTYAEMEFR